MAIISTDSSYTFTVTGDRTLTAVFEQIPTYTIAAVIDPEGSGTVAGAGQYQEGATVTLKAVPGDGYKFTGWQENGQTVSTDNPYTFTAAGNRAFTAAFEVKVSRLPAGYTEVEYVETASTATPLSYVNTGFSMLLTHRYLLDVEFGSPSASSDILYLGTDTRSYSGTQRYENYFTAATLGAKYGQASSVTRYNVASTNGRHTVDLDIKNGQIKFDGNLVASDKPPYATQNPVKLYAPRYCTVRWRVLELYKNDVLSAQLVPCTNSAGTPGFYDLVRQYFYTLTGTTGTITAGPAV